MRVLHLSAGNLYGGVETFLVALARWNAASSIDSAFGLCFEGRLATELRALGADVFQLGGLRLSRPWTVFRARRRLREVMRAQKFDVAVCHGSWPHAAFAATVVEERVPLVYWAHTPPSNEWVDWVGRRHGPDLMIANSRYTLAASAALFRDSPRSVLRYPVSPSPVDERAAVRQAVRREVGTSDADVVIVCSSRLEGWKGHALLLDALALLRDLPNWTAWIAGGAQRPGEKVYLDGLIRAASRLGLQDRVRFVGQRTDIPRILSAADIHCQPNTGPEPFGIAFIEALYAGLPVVTSAMGAATEIVTADCGVLTAPEPEKLAAALRDLIASRRLRLRLSAAGPSRAAALCDPRTALSAIETELARLTETVHV
jgi:glycosyltransferase involved in cell wall biosynthesis